MTESWNYWLVDLSHGVCFCLLLFSHQIAIYEHMDDGDEEME